VLGLPDGTSKTVAWAISDTFAVPAWTSVVHVADGGEDAYLFVMTDKPVLEALRMYVEEESKTIARL
jgi:gentisate 1,2-dioxygenase